MSLQSSGIDGNMNEFYKFLFICFELSLILLGIAMSNYYHEIQDSKLNITYVNGCYYRTNKVFCVHADRSYSDVMETCNHEYLHYKYDKEHWGLK